MLIICQSIALSLDRWTLKLDFRGHFLQLPQICFFSRKHHSFIQCLWSHLPYARSHPDTRHIAVNKTDESTALVGFTLFLLFSQVTLILFFWGDDYSPFQYSTLETWTLFFLWISCPCFHVSYLINLDFIFALASLLCICREILLRVNLIHISCTFLSLPLSFLFLPLSFNTHSPGVSPSIS